MNTRVLNWVAIALALAGMAVAGFLTYAHFSGSEVPCVSGSAGCKAVQDHPSSQWFGIPVALYGVLAFAALTGLGIARVFGLWLKPAAASVYAFWISTIGALVSIGLQIYSITEIKAQCDWCIASAACMCLLFIVNAVLFQGRSDLPEPVRSKPDLGLLAVLGLGTIAGFTFALMSASPGGSTVLDKDRFPTEPRVYLTEGAHALGPDDAPVTIVEFADLYCPACRSSYNRMKELVAEHPGKIRWVFRHWPIFDLQGHEFSLPAAVLSEVAAAKGKFWNFLDAINDADPESTHSMNALYNLLEQVGASSEEARRVLAADESKELLKVHKDMEIGGRIGVYKTPTFVILAEGEPIVALDGPALYRKLEDPKFKALLK